MVDADVEGALLPKTDFSLTDFAEIVQRYVKEFPTHYTSLATFRRKILELTRVFS
jgi:hypothetical protein